MASNNKTSHLVSSQLPDFVRQDHARFVEFLEYYYKSLERDGELLDVTKNFVHYNDIDIVTDNNSTLTQEFYDTFLKMLPKATIADKSIILKHAKDFYRARGSEKSIKFLLRILFDKEAEIYLPKRDILKASDGKWFIERSLRIANTAVNNVSNSIAHHNFVNTTIRGATSNATAVVERVDSYYDKDLLIIELKISNIIKNFDNGEEVFSIFTEEGIDKYLSANTLAGIIVDTTVIDGGNNYVEGTSVPIESNTGTGGIIRISRTTKGSIKGVGVVKTGAGFQANDVILVSGGLGTGARANVIAVNTDGTYHPNSYNIVANTISVEANTPINNTVYSNLVVSISDPCNAWITNSMSYWAFSNCGPIISCFVFDGGSNYDKYPTLDVQSNTIIRSLGILGKLKINDGGTGYSTNDKIEFIGSDTVLTLGSGARANVTNVDANGAITEVKFESINGIDLPGGTGYTNESLPIANVISTGNGANITVVALIGDGEELITIADDIGVIKQLQIINGGTGYLEPPTLNLSSFGDGTAQVNCSIATGVYTYPGRFINDDGVLSSYNFIENENYYQNYSYVIRVGESINKYRKVINDLIHPVGTRLYGEYDYLDGNVIEFQTDIMSSTKNVYTLVAGTYMSNTVTVTKSNTSNITNSGGVFIQPTNPGTLSINVSNVIVNIKSHGLSQNDAVYLTFTSGDTANITNGYYIVTGTANANTFFIEQSNTSNSSGNVSLDVI